MKRYLDNFKYGIVTACGMVVASVFTSCVKNDEPEPEGPLKRTVLVYAVASNNLSGNLVEDKNEMLQAASGMDMKGLSMVVYEVTRNNNPKLSEIVRQRDGSYAFETILEYDKSMYSTDPRRISHVISDMQRLREAENYGLVLWSHGTGIDPDFAEHSTRSLSSDSISFPEMEFYSFGSDNDPDKNSSYYDSIDIDELADAIPSGVFDFIWFDACYMSGIETIYEFRDKCAFFIGYPTEVYTPGMPYHLTMPFFLREKTDLLGGAQSFFDFYAESPSAGMRNATIAVCDMSKIECVADACREFYPGSVPVAADGLLKYSRGKKIGPFYDFGQVSRRLAQNAGIDSEAFDDAMKNFVIWSASTERDFNGSVIPADNFSGISCHLYDPESPSKKDEYYKTLDWCKRVY